MNRWKHIAVALTVVVSALSGCCGFLAKERPPQQVANESAPKAGPSNPRTGFTCCPVPKGASGAKDFCVPGAKSYWYKSGIFGYEITGNGSAWFRSDTREYCVEEGGSIHFPKREPIEGPKSGKY